MWFPLRETVLWAMLLPIQQQGTISPVDASHTELHSTNIDNINTHVQRAQPNAPNGYSPEEVECPQNRPAVRSARTLSPNETSWLDIRRNKTREPMHTLLTRLNISNFDVDNFFNTTKSALELPNIAIAASGGGYRAMLNGAGAVAAFDSRTENSTAPGQLGGLLQSCTYFSGLSGGSWLVGSIFVNNFTTVADLLSDTSGNVWELENSIVQGPTTESNYYQQLVDVVSGKLDAGFNVSITDYWGRALSYQLVNASQGGPAYTWSSLALSPDFIAGNMPLPIVIADERAPGELLIASNTTIFEFNPWEFGTWDETTNGFIPLAYLGSNFSAGILPASVQCVRGFDNVGFVMGTSSSLFNQGLLTINNTDLNKALTNAITGVLTSVSNENNDISLYAPNPFYHYNNRTNDNANSTTLFLVDGGEDLQNIPLQPLLQPNRRVDVIFALDSSADTANRWPNGTSLYTTYQRSLNTTSVFGGTPFPPIPDQNTFVNLGLNSRPTFFGCNSSDVANPPPLIVYIPNAPYTYYSNVSTFDLQYNNTERNAIVQNGYNVATMANGTEDAQWPTCVGCAILSTSLKRRSMEVPAACEECFQKYCWNGTVNSTTPLSYSPTAVLTTVDVSSGAAISFSKVNWLFVLFLFILQLTVRRFIF